MGFNLQAFLGGAATGIAESMEKEEDRLAEIAKEQRLISNNLSYQRKLSRDKEKVATEELASELSVYFSPDQIEEILSKGNGASKRTLELAAKATAAGMDASPLINMGNAAELTENETEEFAQSVLESSTTTGDSDSLVDTSTSTVGSGGLFNLNYIKEINAPADKQQATLDAAYAVATQKSLTAKTDAEREKQATLATKILEQIKIKNQLIEGEGKESNPFGKSTIENMQKTQVKLALEENKFRVDLEGRLTETIGGRTVSYNVAMLQANSNMRVLNTGTDGNPMSPQLNTLTKNNASKAIKNIQLHARQQHLQPKLSSATTDKSFIDKRVNFGEPLQRYTTQAVEGVEKQVDNLQNNAKKGMYTIGDIVYVNETSTGSGTSELITKMYVYTGMPISNIHNNFIYAGNV